MKNSKPISVYIGVLKLWHFHMNFCMRATLNWWKINMNLKGNHKNDTWHENYKHFFQQTYYIARFLYVVQKTRKTVIGHHAYWGNMACGLCFYPITVSILTVVPAFSTTWQYFFVSSHFSDLKEARFTFNSRIIDMSPGINVLRMHLADPICDWLAALLRVQGVKWLGSKVYEPIGNISLWVVIHNFNSISFKIWAHWSPQNYAYALIAPLSWYE